MAKKDKFEKYEIDNVKIMQRALASADTQLKFQFSQFCKTYGISSDMVKWGFIPPENDVKNITEILKKGLSDHGIDLETAKSIPMSDFAKIIDSARNYMKQRELEVFRSEAFQDIKQLGAYDKPIIAITNAHYSCDRLEHLYAEDPEAVISRTAWLSENEKLVGGTIHFAASVTPLQQYQENKRFSKDQFHQDLEVKEFLQLSHGVAIVTDDAIYVNCYDDKYGLPLSQAYDQLLHEQGIEYPKKNGIEGVQAMFEYEAARNQNIDITDLTQKNQDYSIADVLRNDNIAYADKFQYLAQFIEAMQSQGDYGTYCLNGTHNVNFVSENGYHACYLEDVQPGMVIKSDIAHQFEEMDTGYLIGTHKRFEVLDVARFGGDTVVFTDRGIIANRDIGPELGIDKSLDRGFTIGNNE